MRFVALPFVFLLFGGAFLGDLQRANARNDDAMAIAIYSTPGEESGSIGPKLIIGIWMDGAIVWSDNQLSGGAPFKYGTIPPERILAAINRLVRIGLFEHPDLARKRFGPHSQFTTIVIREGENELKMRSSHEHLDVGMLQSESYKQGDYLNRFVVSGMEIGSFFRLCWLECRLEAEFLLPKNEGGGLGKELTCISRSGFDNYDWRLVTKKTTNFDAVTKVEANSWRGPNLFGISLVSIFLMFAAWFTYVKYRRVLSHKN